MSDPSIEKEVRDYYERETLSEHRMREIIDVGEFAIAARRWKRIAVGALIGLAAMILVALGLAVKPTLNQTPKADADKHQTAEPSQPMKGEENSPSPKNQNAPPAIFANEYRLVAFRSHGNDCPHCQATGEVFQQLTSELQNEPIDAEQFDLSQIDRQAETQARLKELQLESLVEGRRETAFLAIIDADGVPIQEYKPSLRAKRIAADIRKLITK